MENQKKNTFTKDASDLFCGQKHSNTIVRSRTTDTQWSHKSKKSENLGRCGRQNILRPYLKIWEWELIFGRVVKVIPSPGVRSPWSRLLENDCAVCTRPKGQLISEWLFDVLNFPKNNEKIWWISALESRNWWNWKNKGPFMYYICQVAPNQWLWAI